MSVLVRHSVLFNRIVLSAATLLFTLIGIRYVLAPLAEAAPHQISLGSPEAITIMRVTGSVFLAIAFVLVACVVSQPRIIFGTGLLATVIVVVTVVRVFGLIVDGAAPFTIQVLKPELVLVVLSSLAFLVERRRLKALD